MEININDTFSTVGSRNNPIVPLESRDETLSSMRSNGTTDTVLRSNIIQAEVNSNDTLSTSTREVDINIEPQDNPYATTHTREFYRGRSFRYAGKWKEHVHYLNDDYITDFVEKDGNLLVCKQSNMSSSENEPSEWVYDGDKIVSVISSYWEVVLVGGLRGKTYLPEYDENSDCLIWRLVQPEDLPESLRTYLGIKDYIDNSLVPIQEDIIDVKSDADVTKRNLSEVEQSVTILGDDLTNLTIISGAISSHVEDLEGNFSDFVQTAEGFFYRVADVEGDLGNLWLTAREFGVQMENVEGDVGRLWLTAQEFGVRMSNTEGDVSQLSIQADEIQTRVENAEGDVSQIHQRADEIWTQVENNQGDISRISQRADEISTRVENAEGDISTIRQTADEIATRVENAEGDVSTISQRADQISSQVENIHGDVSRIEQRADQISSRVENMVGDVSLIQQRADEISSQVENINGDVSRITQRADQIQSEVENQQGDISRITQKADLIESQVSNLDGDVSVISQTADEIQSQVTNLEGDISTISQRADEITSRVANVEGDVSTVTQRADLIESQVSSLDGDVSTISQRADEIQSQVENAEGDISRISQRADIIEAQVQNAEGDVSRITQTADQIQSQVENLAGDVSTITQRADLIESQVSNVEGDISTISQRADEIELRVSNDEGDISQIRQTSNEIALNVSNLEGDVAQLDVKADQISSTVENQQGDISSIIQRADLIEAQVRANKADADGQFVEMSSRITQTAEEIQSEVVANKIDADGKIENANSRITQQAGLIETKVSQTEYDLKTGEIESNVSAIDQKADNINLSVQQVSSRVDQNARDFAKAVNDLQEQIDGAIDTWFYNYAPVHTNAQGVPDSQVPLNVAPYSEWLAAETVEAPEKIRDSHVSDIFYDQDSGYAYRFIGTGNPGSRVYTWIVIQDSAVIKALEDAARAQDTADHKRRVFVANPTVPYDVGDLWVKSTTVGNVSATELYRCTVAKTSAQSADLTNDWAVADSYAKEVSKSNIQILADAIVQQTLTYTYDEYGRLTDDTKSAITTGMNNISLAITGSKLETVGIFIRNANTNDNYINLIADKVRIKGTGNHTPTALGIYWDSTSQSYKISAANLQVEGAFSTTAWTDATTGQRKLVLDDAAAAATGPTGYLTEALYGQDGSASSPTGGVYGTINPMTVALSNFTTITGGLILTTELILGQQSGQSWLPWAGMSGAYDARSQSQGGALGHGIAAWYGGDSVDKASLTTSQIEEGWSNHRWARTLFRMDGSGYLADRKLYWSDQGDLHILGNVTIDGDNYSQTLNEIYNHVITLSSWFVEDTETIPGKTLLRINMGSQQGTGFDGLIFDGFLVTGGDQIVQSGTPGGGGGGGTPFLYELLDFKNGVTQKPATQKIIAFNPTAQDKNGNTGAWEYADIPTGSVQGVKRTSDQSAFTPDASGIVTIPDYPTIPSTYAWSAITSKPTTIGGYGITDAKIDNGEITLGSNTITPLVSSNIKTMTLKVGTGSIGTYDPIGQNNQTLTIGANDLTAVLNSVYHPLGGEHDAAVAKTFYIGGAKFTWHPETSSGAGDSYLELDSAIVTQGDQIVNSGTPGGGSGGGTPYLYELLDFSGSISAKPSAQKIIAFDPTLTDKNGNTGAWKYVDMPTGSVTSVAGVSPTNGDVPAADLKTALGISALSGYGVATSVLQTDTDKLVTGAAVWAAIDALPEPMVFKGSLGTGGTISSLPVNGTASIGDTYKVITAGTYAGKTAKVGDTFICDSKTSSANTWTLIPSGDEPEGTVTSVGLTLPTGLSVSGSPITTSGTFAVTFASGYSIPLTADVTKGVTAYGYFDANGKVKQENLPTMYIGNAEVKFSAQTAQNIGGLGNVTASGLIKTTNYAQATRFYLTDSIYFYTETVNNTVCVHLNAPFITDGDQIVVSGTPGGGGTGGAGYMYELGDVYASGNKIQRFYDNVTSGNVLYGDVLVYRNVNGNPKWAATPASVIGGVTSVAGYTGAVTAAQIQSAIGLGNYVTLNTAQTITALKTHSAGLLVSGRVYGTDDDEGIIITPSNNGYATLALGSHNARRALFTLPPSNAPKFRYNNGTTNYDLIYPLKSGTIALTSDIPTTLPASDVYAWAKASTKPSYAFVEITDKIVSTNEFNFVPTGYNNHVWFNYRGSAGTSSTATITEYRFGSGAGDGTMVPVVASKFIVGSGTSSQFLKANGDLDSTTYQTRVSALGSTTKPVYTSAAGTFAECSTYAGGTAVTLNGTSKAASTASFYAPTSAGTSGYWLKSSGSGAPTWDSVANMVAGRSNYADALRDPDYHSFPGGRRTSGNLNYNDGALHYYLATSSMTTGKPAGDSMILHCAWDNSGYNAQLAIPIEARNLQHRYSDRSENWSDWKTLAFITDNVASATKLETSRTIWGQSFDGTANVSGAISGATTIDATDFITIANNKAFRGTDTGGTARTLLSLDSANRVYLAYGTTSAGYNTYIEGNNITFRIGTTHSSLMYLSSAGRVGIGVAEPSYKFQVNGQGMFQGTEWKGLMVKRTQSGGAWIVFYPNNQETSYWNCGASSEATPLFKWEYSGTTKVASLSSTGVFTSIGDQVVSSDATKKRNWQPLSYGVEDIAKCTAGTFEWIADGRKSAGSKAQDWKGLVPELVHGEVGNMTLAYGQIALLNTVLLARHETEQDKEIRELKEKLFNAENRIKDLENRLKIS